MIDVSRAIEALARAGIGSEDLARALHVSPFLVQGWRDGSTISRPSLRMLRGWVGHELQVHNASPLYPGWIQRGAALRRAYDALTIDPDSELIANVLATMRNAGSLVSTLADQQNAYSHILTAPALAAEAERLLAPFRASGYERTLRIDQAFE